MSAEWYLRCIGCGSTFREEPEDFRCPKCDDLLELEKEGLPELRELYASGGKGIWRFSCALPLKEIFSVSLEEGNTPLVKSSNIGEQKIDLHFKVEGSNPTGSFKDRGMTVAISHAISRGARVALCASTGNTSSSLAAYSARAGISSFVIVPENAVSPAKLVQAHLYGASIFKVKGNFDSALKKARSLALSHGAYLVNSINPYRIEGQKTVSYEIYEQLGMRMPDYVFLPVGNAGNISAVFKGFSELVRMGAREELPKIVGVQAEGAGPIAEAFSKNRQTIKPVKNPKTIASAIRIGNPVSWKKCIRAVRESKGTVISVTDEEILASRDELARKEGILVETASAASLAGLRKMISRIPAGSSVVCILTGTGLKDASETASRVVMHDISELRKLLIL